MKVLIIGAGASGMAAGVMAASLGHEVIIAERQARVGRKLMATGNGRCNLTNVGAGISNYHGADPDFIRPALNLYPPEAILDWFLSLGLLTVTEYGGRVYPLSNSANSVVDTLRYAMDARGVTLLPACQVRTLSRERGGFTAGTDERTIRADAVIIACGGMAGEKLGGVKDGYELLRSLGHSRTALRPALVQLRTDPAFPRALKGVHADCALSVIDCAECIQAAAGEILFTETGVSGPAAFELSRTVSVNSERPLILALDFLRGYSEKEVAALLLARRTDYPALAAGEILTGALHNRLGRMIVKYSGLDAALSLGETPKSDIYRLARCCKRLELPLRGTEGFQNAQVTAGGIKTSEFDPQTLQSRLVPNLYACGEVLDIDGDCGGYNLQWAWASGLLAGRLG